MPASLCKEQTGEKTNNGTHYKLQLLYSNGEWVQKMTQTRHMPLHLNHILISLYCQIMTCRISLFSSASMGARQAMYGNEGNEVHVVSSSQHLLNAPPPHHHHHHSPMVLPHQIRGIHRNFGSHEPLLPLLCRSGTHGREDKRRVPEQAAETHAYIQVH